MDWNAFISSSEIYIHWRSTCNVQIWLILFPFCTKEEAKTVNEEKCTCALIFHNCQVSKCHVRFCSICNFVSSSFLSNEVHFADAKTEFREVRELSHTANKSRGSGFEAVAACCQIPNSLPPCSIISLWRAPPQSTHLWCFFSKTLHSLHSRAQPSWTSDSQTWF